MREFFGNGKYFFKEIKCRTYSRRGLRTAVEAEVRKSGRPPLSGDRAITLEEQRERKKGLQQLVRKNMRLRKVRQLALSCRKDRQGPNSVLTDDDEDLFENVELMEDSDSDPAELLPPAD